MPRATQSKHQSLQLINWFQHRSTMLIALQVLVFNMPVIAQTQTTSAGTAHYSIPPGSLEKSLNRFASQADIAISVDANQIKGLTSSSLQGIYGIESGLATLLRNSGFGYKKDNSGYVLVQKAAAQGPTASDAHVFPEITIKSFEDPSSPYNRSYTPPKASAIAKTNIPIMQSPFSVQAIPESVMKEQQAYRIQDVIKNVSGVQVWHGYGGSVEGFIMRGFLQSPLNYRNGIRIPATKFDLANVERLEVLKGASAMLYGFSDPGGMISTVTKQPSHNPIIPLNNASVLTIFIVPKFAPRDL